MVVSGCEGRTKEREGRRQIHINGCQVVIVESTYLSSELLPWV